MSLLTTTVATSPAERTAEAFLKIKRRIGELDPEMFADAFSSFVVAYESEMRIWRIRLYIIALLLIGVGILLASLVPTGTYATLLSAPNTGHGVDWPVLMSLVGYLIAAVAYSTVYASFRRWGADRARRAGERAVHRMQSREIGSFPA
jgi:hypothetical protein